MQAQACAGFAVFLDGCSCLVLIAGANANNGTNVGRFYGNWNNTAGNGNWNIAVFRLFLVCP